MHKGRIADPLRRDPRKQRTQALAALCFLSQLMNLRCTSSSAQSSGNPLLRFTSRSDSTDSTAVTPGSARKTSRVNTP
jgi:hypothetical protein